MLDFFAQNWGTILVSAVLLAVVVLIITKLCRDRKKGKSSCGCGCENCPSAGMCQKK